MWYSLFRRARWSDAEKRIEPFPVRGSIQRARAVGFWGASHQMSMKLRDSYSSRYIRIGASYGFTMPPDLREAMNLHAGDTLVMNYSEGVLWVVKLTPSIVIPRAKVAAILDKLFPQKESSNGSDR